MYTVYSSRGAGFEAGPRFRLLVDALRYVKKRRRDASFAIREPSGDWYQWPIFEAQILPREEPRRRMPLRTAGQAADRRRHF